MMSEIQKVATDYVAGRINLSQLAKWLNDHLTAYADSPDDDPASHLFGFAQVRVWQHDDGHLDDATIRHDLTEYLREEGLVSATETQRATG